MRKNRDAVPVLLCGALYLLWFFLLEQRATDHYHIIHVALDDYIPFCEYFIGPYLLWFPYVLLPWVWFYRHDRALFRRLSYFLFTGMFTSLVFCTLYANGTDFRPRVSADKNIFCYAVNILYGADTPTNVLPSIHVYNSLGIHIAVSQSEKLRRNIGLRAASGILCFLICLSTMFLKQHSVVDVIVACFMAYAVYNAVYVPVSEEETARSQRRRALLHRSVD